MSARTDSTRGAPGGHAEKEGGQGEVRSMLTAVKGVLAEMRAADVARQHDEAGGWLAACSRSWTAGAGAVS